MNCGARATSSPVASNTADRPSNTSSSWPPTWLQKARAAAQSSARVASIPSRRSPLPRWYGEAEMQQTRSTPRRGEVGGHGGRVPDVLADGDADAHAERLDHERRRRRRGSSGPRRRRRSSAGSACGRRPARGRRPPRRRRCGTPRPTRGTRSRADAAAHAQRRRPSSASRDGRREARAQQQVLRRIAGHRELGRPGSRRRRPRPRSRSACAERDRRCPSMSPTTVFSCASAILRAPLPMSRADRPPGVRMPAHGKVLPHSRYAPRTASTAPREARSGRRIDARQPSTPEAAGRHRRRTGRRPRRTRGTREPEPARGRRGGGAPPRPPVLPRGAEGRRDVRLRRVPVPDPQPRGPAHLPGLRRDRLGLHGRRARGPCPRARSPARRPGRPLRRPVRWSRRASSSRRRSRCRRTSSSSRKRAIRPRPALTVPEQSAANPLPGPRSSHIRAMDHPPDIAGPPGPGNTSEVE